MNPNQMAELLAHKTAVAKVAKETREVVYSTSTDQPRQRRKTKPRTNG